MSAHGVTPEPPAGSAQYRHGWRDGYEQAGIETERLHTWSGLMSLLDEHYPAGVPLGPESDPGPRILTLMREVQRLRSRDEAAQSVVRAAGQLLILVEERQNEAAIQRAAAALRVALPGWADVRGDALGRAHEEVGR